MERKEATINDLYRVPDNRRAELVDGTIVILPPMGGVPGLVKGEILASLRVYTQRTKTGHALPGNVGFVVDLPHRKSFSPDAAYYIGPLTMEFIEGAPVFAVEVRSEGDYGPAAERAMAAKRADYFAAGTKVVWDVDFESEDVVRAYRAEDPNVPLVFRRGDFAHAEPAVPGWSMPVDDLFASSS